MFIVKHILRHCCVYLCIYIQFKYAHIYIYTCIHSIYIYVYIHVCVYTYTYIHIQFNYIIYSACVHLTFVLLATSGNIPHPGAEVHDANGKGDGIDGTVITLCYWLCDPWYGMFFFLATMIYSLWPSENLFHNGHL